MNLETLLNIEGAIFDAWAVFTAVLVIVFDFDPPFVRSKP